MSKFNKKKKGVSIQLTAFEQNVEKPPTHVEKMYTHLYTFSYTSNPDLTHAYFFPSSDANDLYNDLSTIFDFYGQQRIFSTYSCDVIMGDQTRILQEIMIMNGGVETSPTTSLEEHPIPYLQYHRLSGVKLTPNLIFSMLFESCEIYKTISFQSDKDQKKKEENVVVQSNRALGYSCFFTKQWIFPLFEAKTIPCNPLPSSIPHESVYDWYVESLATIPYQELLSRCVSLIRYSSQNASTGSTSKDAAPTAEEDDKKQEVDHDFMKTFMEAYIESSESSEILLSALYADYEIVCNRCKLSKQQIASFFTFTRALRLAFPNSIKRKAKGIVLFGYKSLVNDSKRNHPIYTPNDIIGYKEYYRSKKELIENMNVSYIRDIVMMLKDCKLPLTYHLCLMFYYDPIVHDSIESFKKYYDIILEANEEDLEATFKRINRYSSENKIPVAKYPFSKTTLGRTIHEPVSMSSFCLKTQSVVDGCQPSHIFHSPLLGTNIDISRPLSATNYSSAPSEDPVSYSFGTSVSETPLDECFKPL